LEPAEAMVVKPNITPNWASIKSPQTIMILEGDHMASWHKKQQQNDPLDSISKSMLGCGSILA